MGCASCRPNGLYGLSRQLTTADYVPVLGLERFTAVELFLPVSRALPDHARKALERHQRRAGVGPFLHFFDSEMIERLAAGAALEQSAGDVDHVRRAGALVEQRRAAGFAKTSRGLRN